MATPAIHSSLKADPFPGRTGDYLYHLRDFSHGCVLYLFVPDPSARTHSFILGSLLLAGGIELLFFGIIIKVYSVMHGYEKREGVVRFLLNYHTLEKFLIVGAVLIFSGLLVGAYILYSWIISGFGPLNQITNAVLSLSLVILGLFIVFGSVLISMMCLNDESYSDS